MTHVTSAQGNGHRDGLPPVPSIPLADDLTAAAGEHSIGTLVKDATAHLSTLVRAEVELAKAEVAREVKKALISGVFFIIALTVSLYATFFLFFFAAEGLADIGMMRSWAFLTVFGFMAVVIVVTAVLGYRKIRKIRAPQRTIDSVKETAAVLRHRGSDEPRA